MEKEVVKTNEKSNQTTIEAQLKLAEIIVKSGLSPLKKPEDVLVAIMTGKELGFSEMVSINNIYSINGRAGLGIHLLSALLLKNNIRYEVIEDFYTPNPSDNTSTNTNNTPRTKIKFTRWFKNPDGTHERVETMFTYSFREAVLQGLTDKDNWKKMPKIMLRTRCLTLGARLVAPDVLLGMQEYTELAEIENREKDVVDNREFASAEIVDENVK